MLGRYQLLNIPGTGTGTGMKSFVKNCYQPGIGIRFFYNFDISLVW
jgi:hypothetical protein